MRIRIEYQAGVIDEYPIERENASKLVEHFLETPNVIKVTLLKEKRNQRK